jgi:hypothetical protein
MATVPNVQLAINGDKTQVFWDVDLEGYYPYWNLYRASDFGVDDAILIGKIPNISDAYYSKHHVVVNFQRPFADVTPFYLWLKGVLVGGSEDSAHPGIARYIPALNEIEPMIKQKTFGFDPDTGVWRPVKVIKDTDPSIAGVLDVTP